MQRTVDFKTLLGLQVNFLQAKCPRGHPKVGELIPDYSGTAKVTEEEQTTYYDGVAGASTLPKNITITNGIGKISIDSVSNNTISNGEIVWPIKAKVKVELDNVGSIDEYLVEQWVKDSDLVVSENIGQTNNPQMPDWLEKQSWDAVHKYRGASGLLGMVVSLAKNIILWDTKINKACGETSIVLPDNTINSSIITIGVSCSKTHRKNVNNILSKTVVHELRHIWQNIQIVARPIGASGTEPINDSDFDTCFEVVGNDTEAGPENSTPLQDGVTVIDGTNTYVTHGDNNNLNGEEQNVCQELWELDAYEFENHVK